MKRIERLGRATAPDGTVLELHRHDGAYTIRVGGIELMSSRRHHSEEALAEVACASLRERAGACVLVGGLGLGFTLRATLGLLASDARVVVAELVPEVVEWNMDPAYELARPSLLDERVDLRVADVARVLEESPDAFDGIMLDVDNGAEPLTTGGNARLYSDTGIGVAAAALRPGGRVAYWSAGADAELERALRRHGLRVESVRSARRPGSRSGHAIIVGRRR